MFASLRIVAACAAVASFALAAPALADPSDLGGTINGGSYHIYRTPEMWRQLGKSPDLGTTGQMEYFGGTVFSKVKVVSVIWGSNVNKQTVNGMPGFLTALPNSTFLDQMEEYDTKGVVGVNGRTGKQTIHRGTFLGQIQITPKNTNTQLTDKDVQNEITYQISIGVLPAKDANTLYMTYFPSNVTINLGGLISCQSFGAYHFASNTANGTKRTKKTFYYGVMPDCGYTFNDHTIVTAHEFAEALSDNIPTPGSSPAYPQAWNTSTGYEIGDLCEGTQGTLTAGKTTYYVQQIYLNSIAGCSTGNYTSP